MLLRSVGPSPRSLLLLLSALNYLAIDN